jgi:hypothetical protein
MFWMIKEMYRGCPFPWERSALACWWSVVDLLKGKPYSYLWTFTVAEEVEPKEFAQRHKRLLWLIAREIRKGRFPSDWGGVRVFEHHPGGHGLHAHWVVDQRFEVGLLRPLAQTAGFGRVNVLSREASEAAARYLAKYVGKQNQSLGGLHRWACIGPSRGHAHSVHDVKITTSIDERFAQYYWEYRESFPEYGSMGDGAQWYARVAIESEDFGFPPEKLLPKNREFVWGKSFPVVTLEQDPF